MDLLILVSTSTANLFLLLLVYLRNIKSIVNKRFSYFTGSLIVWTIFNFLADFAPSYNLQFTKFTLAAGILMAITAMQLCEVFPDGKNIRTSKKVSTILNILGILLILTAI